MKKYTKKELHWFANTEIIYPKKSTHYEKLLKKHLKAESIDISKADHIEFSSDALLWDCCEIINNLAQQLLDEREERISAINCLQDQFKATITELKAI